MEAQPYLFLGDVAAALWRFEEAVRIGAPVDTTVLWRRETFRADLAMAQGRHGEALGHYAESLAVAQALGNEVQVLLDLEGICWMLARLGDDADALEAAGLADAQAKDVQGSFEGSGVPYEGNLAAAEARLGAARAAALRARGRAVPAGSRVSHARALAAQRSA